MSVVLLIVGAFAGVIASKAWDLAARYLNTIRPAGRLWGWLAIKGPVQIVLSTGLMHDDEYTTLVFPTEAQAAAEIKSYLDATLHQKVFQHQADGLGENLKDDLIVIGGPVNNEVAQTILNMPGIPFRYEGHTIIHRETGQRWHAATQLVNGRISVSTDYCLIIRTRSPFNDNRGVLLIGGSRAYGSLAGARVMLQNRARDTLERIEGMGDQYAALVEAKVHNGVPGEPTVIEIWPL